MATITPPTRTRNLSESNQRVRSPLARLRGYIRGYVSLEGVLLLVLLLALWFWIGLAIDYGAFKLFAFDWVQEWPWAVRLVLLVLLTAGVATAVSLNVFGRLFRDFTDAALALVLERRFPKLLGDRLITAVELSDLKKAEEQGYSPAMVLETIHEAAERVQEVPVQKAFDWGRLIRRGALALGLTLGLYLLAGGLFLALDLHAGTRAGRTGYGRFNETAQIWFERNILLQNTIWPRRAQLEFVNFPGNELRLGQGGKAPSLRMRALEYVIADPNSPEGWRALTWNDLSTHRDWIFGGPPASAPFVLTPRDATLGLTVDEAALRNRKFEVRIVSSGQGLPHWVVTDPAADGGRRPLLWADLTPERLDGLTPPKAEGAWMVSDPSVGLTVDDVDTQLSEAIPHNAAEWAADARVVLSRLGRLAELSATLDQVDALATRPEMSRTMRHLDLPEIIYLKCTGDKTYLRNEMHKGQDNEYSGAFGDLKESVVFNVQADDYYTPRRTITLVPPPSLIGLDVEEQRPAYLYYRPTEATTLAFLHGKKQPFAKHDVLQAGSETSRIDVPGGTDLVLTARSDKPLREAFLKAGKNVEEIRIRVAPSKLHGEEAGAAPFGPEAAFKVPEGAEPGVVVLRQTKVGEAIRLPLDIAPGGKGFQLDLPNVRQDLVFEFEFTDTDSVKGKRKVVVKPQDDTAPELTDVQLETIRKAALKIKDKDGKEHEETYFLVTRKARIPISAKVHDDHMLGDVRYRYTLNTAVRADVNAILEVPVVWLAVPTGGPNPFQAAAYLAAQEHDADSYTPPLFAQTVQNAQDALPFQTVQDQLGQAQLPPYRQLVRDVEIKPDQIEVFPPAPGQAGKNAQDNRLDWDFPLWKLRQLQDLEDNHPPYRMDLWLEATDTDADEQLGQDGQPRPHLSKSKETFAFLIVPESMLLAKIGEDEVKQYASLNKRVQDLEEKAGLMDTGVKSLDRPDVQVKDLLGPSTRAEQINEVLENSLATTREVYGNYQRMVKEEELNVIRIEKITKNQDTILAPLKQIIDDDFVQVIESNAKFRKALDDKGMSDKERIVASQAAGKDVSQKMATLLKDLKDVLEVMKGIGGLADLVEQAMHIADGVHNIQVAADTLKVILENAFFDNPTPKK